MSDNVAFAVSYGGFAMNGCLDGSVPPQQVDSHPLKIKRRAIFIL
eukprot:COSAG02_NODE_22092_length_763_cov_1.760542_1_plen_44_part_10